MNSFMLVAVFAMILQYMVVPSILGYAAYSISKRKARLQSLWIIFSVVFPPSLFLLFAMSVRTGGVRFKDIRWYKKALEIFGVLLAALATLLVAFWLLLYTGGSF